MKNLLFTLCLLGCSLFVSAQCEVTISADSTAAGLTLTANTINNMAVTFEWNSGETTQTINANPGNFDYCVTATFGNGCIATACFGGPSCGVSIAEIQNGDWVQATANGQAPFTYQWSNGLTDAAIPIGATDSILCVVVTDANGCEATDCIEFIIDCGAYIQLQVDSSTNAETLFALPYGNPPFTFAWDNGATTQTITPNAFGTYCVTITDAENCVAGYCYEYIGSTNCEVNIFSDGTGNGDEVQLTAISVNGGFPWTYEWSTGATTSDIIVSEAGTYCVTVTNADGCVASDCFTFVGAPDCDVTITEASTPVGGTVLVANPEGEAPYLFYWNTGETTQSIIPNGTGNYCVSLFTNANSQDSCFASACFYFTDPNDCAVSIYTLDSLQNTPNNTLVAATSGIGNFTYEWSTGETTSEIDITENGDYCVTVTSTFGCVATSCFEYNYSACSATIDQSGSISTSMDLCAVSTGVAPFTYLWSTGETTECINTNVTGTYGVTITDSDGCVSEVCCLTFVFPTPNYGLEGTVYTIDSINGGLNIEGWVYRIGINQDGTASLIDSTEITTDPSGSAGYYDFGDVAAGTYLVKAALTEGATNYETTLPTYHFNSLTWGEADMITVPTMNSFPFYNISMIPGDNPGGPGGIYGSVIVGDGFVVDPIPNTSILLFDESENPMLHVLTDGNGEFAFPELPWGTYKVQIEVVGQEPAWYWVTIGPDNPTAEGLIFEVSEFGITTNIAEVLATETFNVFPNPANDYLMVQFNATKATEVQISLTSITGQTLLVDNQLLNVGGQNIEMDVTKIPTGIYFINIANGKDVISQKVVIR